MQKLLSFLAPLATVAGVSACSEGTTPGNAGPTLSVTVAPLTLPQMTDACYGVTVYGRVGSDAAPLTADDVVWSEDALCASRYGAEGGIRFTGICDAAAGRNAVRLVLADIYTDGTADGGGFALTDGVDYINPCPAAPEGVDNGCLLEAPCEADADTKVVFNLTVMRQAEAGFFDTVVRLDEVFCAAKLDCVDQGGAPLTYLWNPNAEPPADGVTAVLAFTCVGGAGGPPFMYLDDVVVACTGGGTARTAIVHPGDGPGLVTPDQAPAGSPVLFSAAVNTGEGFEGSVFWNVLLGLNLDGASGETCTVQTAGTVSETALTGDATPGSTRYPYISWDVGLTAGASLACARHPLNGGNGVATHYTDIDEPRTFAWRLGESCEPAGAACDDGVVTTVGDLCAAGRCAGIPCEGAACSGTTATASAAPGERLALEGVTLEVPADAAGPLSVTSSTETPPATAENGASIVALSPVYTFGPDGTTFDPPLALSFEVGAATDATVFWSSDGARWVELTGAQSGGTLTVSTSHFSRGVVAAEPCAGKSAHAICGAAPSGLCAAAPTCEGATGARRCTAAHAAVGTPCDDGDPSTDADACDASGACVGTAGGDGVCRVGESPSSPDCDGVCDAPTTDEWSSPDCEGACEVDDAWFGFDCNGFCDDPDGAAGPDCDGLCEVGDGSQSPDCDGLCEGGDELGSPDCDGVCRVVENGTVDCDLTCEVGDEAGTFDCDGDCNLGDEAGSADCDGTCLVTDWGGSADCDAVCDLGDAAFSMDCDFVCGLADAAGSPDCNGTCGGVPWYDVTGSPDCDGRCDPTDDWGSADCDGACTVDDVPGSPDCEGWCNTTDAVGSSDCNTVCGLFDVAGSPDCDAVCDVADQVDSPDCDHRCDTADMGGSPDCDGACNDALGSGNPDATGSPDCDGLCGVGDESGSPDCDNSCSSGDASDSVDCDAICDPSEVAGSPDCNGACDSASPSGTLDVEAGSIDCDGQCAVNDVAFGPDCDGSCSFGDESGSPDCDGVCQSTDLLGSIDCNGVCGAAAESGGPDCDGVCDGADLSPGPDCP